MLDPVTKMEIVTNLKRNIEENLSGSTATWITPKIIYLHSNIKDLSSVSVKFLNADTFPVEDADANSLRP